MSLIKPTVLEGFTLDVTCGSWVVPVAIRVAFRLAETLYLFKIINLGAF